MNPFDTLNASIKDQNQRFTKREYIAAMLLQGLLSALKVTPTDEMLTEIVKASVCLTDELTKACADKQY